MFDMVSTKVGF